MLGIDISDNSIKVVELSEGESPRLEALYWSSLPKGIVQGGRVVDGQELAAIIKHAMANSLPGSIWDRKVVASIPERHTFIQVVEVPAMAEADTNEAITWVAREHLPVDMDKVYLDWQPLSDVATEPSKRPVLLGAAKRDAVDPLVKVLDDIGAQTVALEPGPLAVVRSVLPAQSENVEDIVVLDLGALTTDIIFFDKGSVRLTAGVPRGGQHLNQALMSELQLPVAEAERQLAQIGVSANVADAQVAAVLRDAVRDLFEQARKVVRAMVAQTSYLRDPKAVLLTGGSANIPGITELVGAVFPGVSVQLARPWTNIVIDKRFKGIELTKEDAMHFTTGIGLALRRTDYVNRSPHHEVNLLPTMRYHSLTRQVAAAAGVAALQSNIIGIGAALLVAAVAWSAFFFRTGSEAASVGQALSAEKATFQSLQADVQAQSSLLDAVNNIEMGRPIWSDITQQILQAVAPGTVISRLQATSFERKVRLYGDAPSRNALIITEQRLREIPDVAQVISPRDNFLSDNPAFTIEVLIREKGAQ